MRRKDEEPVVVLSEFEAQVASELEAAKADRNRWEGEWQSNEASLFDVGAEGGALRDSDSLRAGMSEADHGSETDISDNFMGINLSARNMQLLFSQLVSNPPVAMGVPVSNEQEDVDAAKGAESLLLYGRDQYKQDNWIALAWYSAFIYGTGFHKQVYDKTLGAFIKSSLVDKPVPLGDVRVSNPSVWNMFLDVNATDKSELNWLIEQMFVDPQTAIKFFGEEHRDAILGAVIDNKESGEYGNNSLFYTPIHKQVAIYERWEAGSCTNGYRGRLSYHLKNGVMLKDCGESPVAFPLFPKSSGRKAMKARFPYVISTYEDIPNRVWGRSPAAKCARAQNALNAAIMVMLQTAKNVGVPHLVVDKNTLSLPDDKPVSNNPVNIIPLDLADSGMHPYHLQPANTSNDIKELIQFYTNYINDAWGVNDALLGKQARETQGVTMQLSIMQGNLIRERMFSKYVYDVKEVYELMLAYFCKHWPTSKFEDVLGKNSEFKAKAVSAATILGGYSIRIERNMVFALDPITRQEQILNLKDLFKDAQLDSRFLIRQLRLADLRSIYDQFDLADDRAKKNIEYIKEKKEQPTIFKYEDHLGISAYIKEYIMKEEFFKLEPDVQKLIEDQIDKRMDVEAGNRTGGQPPQGAAAPAQQQAMQPQMPPMGAPQLPIA